MLFLYLPFVLLDGFLASIEVAARLRDKQMPARKEGEPTIILLK